MPGIRNRMTGAPSDKALLEKFFFAGLVPDHPSLIFFLGLRQTKAMERVSLLLQKIKDLQSRNAGILEIDLMLDYTRVLYADLLEWRQKAVFNQAVSPIQGKPQEHPGIHPPEHGTEEEITPEEEILPDISASPTEPDDASAQYKSFKEENKSPVIFFETKPPVHKDIRKHIGINEKYQFIHELFSDDTGSYEEIIGEINSFESEGEAISWLNKSVFKQFGWKEDSEAVHQFFQIISHFFAAAEGAD